MASLSRQPGLSGILVHTGQHYDSAMKSAFFEQLGIPEPDIDLGVGSASHAVQTAEIMKRFEPVLDRGSPDGVLVVGDVNSTVACSLVAAKKGVPVIHVEAGLRSFDRDMPEEVNRVITDQLSALLFTTERRAEENLLREGIAAERIRFVGNVMIDTLTANLGRAPAAVATLRRYAEPGTQQWVEGANGFGVVTLHRPSNVDDRQTLKNLLESLAMVGETFPLVFPVHPRTRARLEAMDLVGLAEQGALLLPALGYLEMLGLIRDAAVVLTDSGGIQEETTALGVPCLTLRDNTERPVTVEFGTNMVVGRSRERMLAAVADIAATGGKGGRVPELWDGNAAARIAAELAQWYAV